MASFFPPPSSAAGQTDITSCLLAFECIRGIIMSRDCRARSKRLWLIFWFIRSSSYKILHWFVLPIPSPACDQPTFRIGTKTAARMKAQQYHLPHQLTKSSHHRVSQHQSPPVFSTTTLSHATWMRRCVLDEQCRLLLHIVVVKHSSTLPISSTASPPF